MKYQYWGTGLLLLLAVITGCAVAPQQQQQMVGRSAPANEHLRLNELGNKAMEKEEYGPAAQYYREALTYAPGDGVLERLEREARQARRGLWREANAIAPWEFRGIRSGRRPAVLGR